MIGAPTSRFSSVGVWTGSKLLVWGGRNGSRFLADGAAYDPTADAWTAISSDGAPSARSNAAAVWTGSALLIWGGDGLDHPDGELYDPNTDAWTPMSALDAPDTSIANAAVWDGSEMLIWAKDHGVAYNPTPDRWRELPQEGEPSARVSSVIPIPSIWTGSEWIVWGGLSSTSLEALSDGARYSPPTQECDSTPVKSSIEPS
jgi:hypothetical protein